jgi:hypothetical protein
MIHHEFFGLRRETVFGFVTRRTPKLLQTSGEGCEDGADPSNIHL